MDAQRAVVFRPEQDHRVRSRFQVEYLDVAVLPEVLLANWLLCQVDYMWNRFPSYTCCRWAFGGGEVTEAAARGAWHRGTDVLPDGLGRSGVVGDAFDVLAFAVALLEREVRDREHLRNTASKGEIEATRTT